MKKPKVSKLRTAIVVQSFIIALLVISLAYVYGQTGGTFIISEGIYPHGVSYTIWKEGTTYYAKNAYGNIDYSGTNASEIIISAWNTLTTGGILYFKQGTYTIDVQLSIPYNDIQLTFEKGAILELGANTNLLSFNEKERITIISGELDGKKATYNSDNWNGIIGQTTDSRIKDLYIHDFNGNGIFVPNATNLVLDSVISKNNGNRGIYITTTGAIADESDYCKIINSHTEDNGLRGISISVSIGTIVQGSTSINDGTSDGIHIEANVDLDNIYVIVDSNIVVNSGRYGINFVSYSSGIASRSVISNNIIVNSTEVGIRVYQGSGGLTENVIVEGNQIYDSGTTGISVYNYASQSVIANNIVKNSTTYGIALRGDNHTINGNNIIGSGSDGIYLDYADYNTIVGNIVGENANGIVETGTSDGNIIVANNCRGNTGVGISVSGANTQVNLSWNGTIWIP